MSFAGEIPSDWTALDWRGLGRWMSEIEAGTSLGRRACRVLQEREWPGVNLGVTGPPGCGKSTLVGALAREWTRRGEKVAVLAIDPSSARGGGALLGDRVRMMEDSIDEKIFIRSLATRGQAGGMVLAVADLARLLRAAGYRRVLIETVGVGQNELAVAAQADATVVVQAPGLGDDIQAMKHGVLEIADVLVVNKADLPGAAQLAGELASWTGVPPERILQTNALKGEGVAALADALASAPARSGTRRREEIRVIALSLFSGELDRRLNEGPLPAGDSWTAASELLAEWRRVPRGENNT
jgi:Putative periplasmic protein kinase ArgK and related GTPases of G3E family